MPLWWEGRLTRTRCVARPGRLSTGVGIASPSQSFRVRSQTSLSAPCTPSPPITALGVRCAGQDDEGLLWPRPCAPVQIGVQPLQVKQLPPFCVLSPALPVFVPCSQANMKRYQGALALMERRINLTTRARSFMKKEP